MTDETGLAAALEVKDRDLKAGEPPDFDALADTALAWVDALLTDPATVEAVARAILQQRMGPMALHANDAAKTEVAREATAALAVVRELLGGTGGEG